MTDVSRETSKPTLTASTEQWLATVGLADSNDPNVGVLREACAELDALNSGRYDLAPGALASATKSVRATITNARKALQPLVDEARTEAVVVRHELRYAGIAARTLGLIDPRLLSDEVRDMVAQDLLLGPHGIEMAEYEPNAESV